MSFTARGILHNAVVLLAVGICPKHTPVEEMRISTRLREKAVLFGKETVSDGKQSKKSRRNRYRPKRFEDAQRRTEAPPPKKRDGLFVSCRQMAGKRMKSKTEA